MTSSTRIIGITAYLVILLGLISPGVAAKGGSLQQTVEIAAALDGFEVVTEATPNDNNTPKAITAQCPAGKVIIGGGVRFFGATAGTALTASAPDDSATPTRWIAEAADTEGFFENWGLQVDAYCINANLVNYQVIKAATANNSTGSKSITATCPAGQRLIGGGARITGLIVNEGLTVSFPVVSPQPNQWTASAHEVNSSLAGNWALEAYALCSTTSKFGLIMGSTSTDIASPKSLVLECQQGGTLLGGGAAIGVFNGNYTLTTLHRETARQWRISAQKILQAPVNQNWGLFGYAFCVYHTYTPIIIK
jgi:hypothetical protein